MQEEYAKLYIVKQNHNDKHLRLHKMEKIDDVILKNLNKKNVEEN